MKTILVPIDFTSVSENAVNHAENLARTISAGLHLLHVVAKRSLIDEAEARMQAYVAMINDRFPTLHVNYSVVKGTIFDEIGETAINVDASVIVMGTHGMKGLQFLVGSNALRIVSSSETPIVIVQDRGIKQEGYDDIVVPLDLHKETKQKLAIVVRMAKYFHSRVHLIAPHESDEYLKNTLNRNLAFAAQLMEKEGIEHTTRIAEKRQGSFDEALIHYAVVNEADLIAIMNLRENSLAGLRGGGYTQKIITNEAQIPALLVNPSESGHVDIFGV
jgi:nucleotide-binding universal stress UspA family protein